ncbi:MAG TPA: signal peptidase I [Polyangiaceae bacterium]|nr:signal peptidase I [Polyangiaceae bacterium]
MQKSSLFRSLFWFFWFVVAPLGLAMLVAHSLEASESSGAIPTFVREQKIPAVIVLFTLFEMVLYSLRHQLPFAAALSTVGGRSLSVELRKQLEASGHLLDEAQRILSGNHKAITKRLGPHQLEELEGALAALRAAMIADPFNEQIFGKAFSRSAQLVETHLQPWRKSELREYAESIGLAVLVALLLRAVVVEAFKIPSGSMLPTLQIGDHIFVNKFVYGPTIPFTDTRLFSSMPPKRGDVIVFEYPDPDLRRERQDFIKRVVAIPGDVLEAEGGHPIINGWHVPGCLAGHYTYRETPDSVERGGDLYVEYLSGTAFLALYEDDRVSEHEGPFYVKPGEVWVMGDNRHNSSDSRRWLGGKGAGVPFANIKGRAMFVWLPFSRELVQVMGSPVLPDGAAKEVLAGIAQCLATRPADSDTFPPPTPTSP